MARTYIISEICGDWALQIREPGHPHQFLYFNSENNANLVKSILEWEDTHQNEAVPYKPTLTQPNEGAKDKNVPTNEPMTLKQLREMDGEPVWIVDVGPHKWYGPGWAIVDRDNCLVRTVKNWNAVFFEKYGERWLAYYRPPERQEDT